MIINEWNSVFTQKYGHEFPSSYMTFDTEFTGGSEHDDLVLEIGHALVEEGKVVDSLNVILNWYAHPDVRADWLDYKLNNMRNIVGTGWTLTPEKLKTGIDPIKGLRFYAKLFKTWKSRDLPFVAQNGQSADERMLRGNFHRFLNKPFSLPDNNYFDTGAIFKASEIWNAESGDATNFKVAMLPHQTETLKNYFNRIIYTRVSGVKWSLSKIMDNFGLIEKHAVAEDQFHNAGFDAMCLHWIMEEYRSRVTRNNVTQEITPPNPVREVTGPANAKTKKEKSAKSDTCKTPEEGSRKATKSGFKRRRKQRLI